jgi:hypothetical protein
MAGGWLLRVIADRSLMPPVTPYIAPGRVFAAITSIE